MTSANLREVLMQAWMRRGWLAILLLPVALLFRMLTGLRRILYRIGVLRSFRLPVPVIVIGNIFVGGTGKTPFTLWLLRQLRLAGYHPGVISRGYGGTHDTVLVVGPDSKPEQAGDEPVLIAQHGGCPVVVSRDRYRAAQHLLREFPGTDLIVADDGLQHLALQRDLEVMLFDARGIGNGWLLPAGPLREPANRRADFTIVNLNAGQDMPAELAADSWRMQLAVTELRRLCDPEQCQPLHAFESGLRIVAAAGIGNPSRYFDMLNKLGVQYAPLPLPDHYDFTVNPFADLPADIILITEKDAVKCRQLQEIADDPRIWVVLTETRLDTGLAEAILRKLELRSKKS